jgi:hypothetical protein
MIPRITARSESDIMTWSSDTNSRKLDEPIPTLFHNRHLQV